MSMPEDTNDFWIPMERPSRVKKSGREREEPLRPYTVIDAITKAYGRCFVKDLQDSLDLNLEQFSRDPGNWETVRGRVVSFRVLRPESVFDQPLDDVRVDIAGRARILLEEVSRSSPGLRRTDALEETLRLRYLFDFRPCQMTCGYIGAVRDERDSLLSMNLRRVRLDRYLIPVLDGGIYETIPDWIRWNWFPEDRGTDRPIDPEEWILRMEIPLLKGRIGNPDIQGEYFFDRGEEEIIDPDTGTAERTEINPGSIVLSGSLHEYEAAYRSAAAHEAVHAVFGRYFYCLQRLQKGSFLPYVCKTAGGTGEKREGDRSPFERLEIQANTIPRYLLIPDSAGRERAQRLLSYYGGIRSLRNMERIAADLAEHFGTTKAMARSRLRDFGYPAACGGFRTPDGRLMPPYLSDLPKGMTYMVKEAELLREFARNPELRPELLSGRYQYVPESGCCCRNDGRHLYRDSSGGPHLTPYAREHMRECCLVFRERPAPEGSAARDGISRKTVSGRKANREIVYVSESGGSPVTEEGRDFVREVRRMQESETGFRMSFNQWTRDLMDRRKLRVSDLAEATWISERTIVNMRNDPSVLFPIREIVAVCIAMHLPPRISIPYIGSSPAGFGDTLEMNAYRYVLNCMYDRELCDVNRILVEAGFRPLTRLVAGYDESGRRIPETVRRSGSAS